MVPRKRKPQTMRAVGQARYLDESGPQIHGPGALDLSVRSQSPPASAPWPAPRRPEVEINGSTPIAREATRAPPGAAALRPGPDAARASFVVATERLDNGVPVVSVTGELDLASAPALEDPLLAACDHADGPVAVDLARCGFIDLRGLHVLLARPGAAGA